MPAQAAGPEHTTERHAFRTDEEGDDLCRRLDCRGLEFDPIHGAPPWNALVRNDQGINGFRDFLDGEPIHCGTGLELQMFEYVAVKSTGDEDMLRTDKGVRVRYELAWSTDGGPRPVVLYHTIGGHDFTARVEPWMRFRWPK